MCRTGKYDDHLEMTEKSYLEIDELENIQNIPAHNNCDVLNSHGKVLLELCKNFDLSMYFEWKKKRMTLLEM